MKSYFWLEYVNFLIRIVPKHHVYKILRLILNMNYYRQVLHVKHI